MGSKKNFFFWKAICQIFEKYILWLCTPFMKMRQNASFWFLNEKLENFLSYRMKKIFWSCKEMFWVNLLIFCMRCVFVLSCRQEVMTSFSSLLSLVERVHWYVIDLLFTTNYYTITNQSTILTSAYVPLPSVPRLKSNYHDSVLQIA